MQSLTSLATTMKRPSLCQDVVHSILRREGFKQFDFRYNYEIKCCFVHWPHVGLKIWIVRVLNKLNVVNAALAFILIFLAHIAAMYAEPFEYIIEFHKV
jgi:hypothetical protein